MKKAIKLREEWESLRILLDVVRQREKRKLALLKLQQEVIVNNFYLDSTALKH
jgi:hypothetical protein